MQSTAATTTVKVWVSKWGWNKAGNGLWLPLPNPCPWTAEEDPIPEIPEPQNPHWKTTQLGQALCIWRLLRSFWTAGRLGTGFCIFWMTYLSQNWQGWGSSFPHQAGLGHGELVGRKEGRRRKLCVNNSPQPLPAPCSCPFLGREEMGHGPWVWKKKQPKFLFQLNYTAKASDLWPEGCSHCQTGFKNKYTPCLPVMGFL